MAVEITMPQLSDTMSEGRILTWLKKEGDAVKRGEALAEVATDKADLEIESFHQGVLLKIHSPAGETVRVGSVIAVIGEAGESTGATTVTVAKTPIKEEPKPAPVQSAPQPTTSHAIPSATVVPPTNGHSYEAKEDRVKISPLAKNTAQSLGVDYSNIKGSGDGGRIVRRDIENAAGTSAPRVQAPTSQPPVESRPVAPTPPTPQPIPAGAGTEMLSKMRQTIATRMVEAKTTIPHFYMTAKVSADALAKLKSSLKPLPQYEGLTYNHLVLRAAGLALKAFPRVNAAYLNGALVQPQDVNIGIITAVQDGLLIPIVKRADQLPLADLIAEAKGLVSRARSGRPKADDLMGGTFSISNMGMFPVESFSAIINPGQGGILAVSSIQEEPVVKDGAVRPGLTMRVTLSVDHRIIDGVVAGEWLSEFKRLIEDPVLLLA